MPTMTRTASVRQTADDELPRTSKSSDESDDPFREAVRFARSAGGARDDAARELERRHNAPGE
jgi:hypothetical protein